MEWLKAFHIIFVVTWFAGLFYLPRLFMYHVDVANEAEHQRLCLMERRLYGIMSIGMMLSWIFGLATAMTAMTHHKAYAQVVFVEADWFNLKLVLVVLLTVFHVWLKRLMRGFSEQRNAYSTKFFRIINEVPAVFLIVIVILAVVKPF